jgi:DNA-binding NarL/FixJ family response regulator
MHGAQGTPWEGLKVMATQAARKCYRVLIVEDHPLAASGIAETLNAEPDFEVVAIAESEADAVRAATEFRPDVVTVDMTLSKGTGLGAIKSMTAADPDLRVLVFTMHDELLYAERAMRAGAHGYLNKSAHADELIDAVRTVASGRLAISEGMSEKLVQKAIGNDDGGAGVEDLSDRELEVFEHIGRGQPLSVIAEVLGISVKTVETHRENIKKKLDLASATELARFAVAWVENPG